MAHMKGRFVGSRGQVKIPVLGFRGLGFRVSDLGFRVRIHS